MSRLPLAWILSLWRPHRRLVVPLLVLTVLNGMAVAAVPLAVRDVFDILGRSFTPETLAHGIKVLLAAGLARFAIYACLQNMRAYLNARLEWSIRSRLFRHLIRLSPLFYTRYSAGDLVTRLTDDISDDMKLAWFLCSGFFRCLEAACVVITVAAAMFRLNVPMTLWCLLPLPALFALFVAISGHLEGRFSRLQQAISRVNSEIEATLTGIHLVKAYGMEASRRDAFHQVADGRREAELGAVTGQAMMETVYGYAWQLAAATVLLVGGRQVILGHVSLADFVAFNGLCLALTYPMFDFGQFLTKGRQAIVFIERLQSLEAEAVDIGDGVRTDLPSDGPAYHMEGVGFCYGRDRAPALQGVDLRLPRGGFVAIVGRVGHGKTTLLRLLLRLLDPTAGQVGRSGVPLPELSLDAARRDIGYVPQDPVLLSDSIRENIRFGRPEVDDDRVEEAVAMAQLASDVGGFQDGLSTRVGPRGLQLSGGQKQRVSLARALAGRPSVLVLDDCTASLDAATEARLWQTLRRELPHVTVVVVTHRTAELERADEVLVLGEHGAVVQRGTHRELMAQGGEYRTLYERWQEEEDEIPDAMAV